jgi:predicted ArsR family transcriptional regulator
VDTELEHPVRVALLDLLATAGTLTSNEAARRLGVTSGLTSFHLRQLARAGLIEAAPAADRRARPWRLVQPVGPAVAGLGELDRDLEDEAYLRWVERRAASTLPDQAFSAVIRVTPEQLDAVAQAIREVLAPYQTEDVSAPPTAAIIRLFPLLPSGE